MNLKEAFRYQNFLDKIMNSAHVSIENPAHCLITTRIHKKSLQNPEVADVTEIIEPTDKFYANDNVIKLMEKIVSEKQRLTEKIGKAKASAELDIDAAVETNKYRHQVAEAIKQMLRCVGKNTITQGSDYKFNNEGNQVPYYYEMEICTKEAYNQDEAKKVMKRLISEADSISSQIDATLINTTVDYEAPFNVNDSFEDVMETFIS